MVRKILFATDFSEYANTLDCIAGFPGIILLHVLEEARSLWGIGEIGEVLSPKVRYFLRGERHSLETLEYNFNVAATVKTSSDIAEAIRETAEETGVFGIVVGVRGNSLMDGILLIVSTSSSLR
jgi:nucleotide-binding universal stress UspA family protein